MVVQTGAFLVDLKKEGKYPNTRQKNVQNYDFNFQLNEEISR